MSEDIIQDFLVASTEKRLAMAQDDRYEPALTAYFGHEAYQEYRAIAAKLDQSHLGIEAPKNLIFVPGVMGSLLLSQTKGGVWWIDLRTRQHINDLGLRADGQADANPTYQIVPFTTDPMYEPFTTAVLGRDDFGHELFPYDWRKPLSLSARALRDLISKLHSKNGNQPVHLVAHSMGGLMVRATLMAYGQELWPKIGRIVFMGTPHYGSPAIASYLKNHFWGFELMALLGRYLSRETFRSLWGPIGMLPAPRGLYPGTRPNDPTPWLPGNTNDPYIHPCTNFNMYQTDQWALDLTQVQISELQTILDGAAVFHQQMYEAHQALDQNLRDRMLVIAGVGYQTLFRLEYESQFFGLWERMVKVTARTPGDPHREGDGRVPLASAILENVAIRYVKGVHGGLPNIPVVYNDVFRWLNDEALQLPNTVAAALSTHLAAETVESETPHLDGTAMATPFTDDPGLWNLTPPGSARLEVLQAALEAEQLPAFTRVRLL